MKLLKLVANNRYLAFEFQICAALIIRRFNEQNPKTWRDLFVAWLVR